MIIDAIHKLVGTDYKLYSADPTVGLDCMTMAKLIWEYIGENLKQPAQWIFPLPDSYTDEGMLSEELQGYHIHWMSADQGEFGAIVDLGDHIAVYIGDGDLIHCIRGRGVVISRASRLAPHIRGWYKLKNGVGND